MTIALAFRIAGDIDLSKYVTNGKIPMGLKINSLVGETKSDGGKYTITFGGKEYSTASAVAPFNAWSG